MTEPASALTETANPPRIWNTSDVPAPEAFDYYREGICAAFMPLAPELPRASQTGFRSVVRSYDLTEGALNLVSARAHQVLRTPAGIAASPEPCWYLNLQLDGICGIEQSGTRVDLRPGEVGLFHSDRVFALDHSRRAGLRVASLLVPKRVLPLPEDLGPCRLSDHPVYGRLVTEAAGSLGATAEQGGDCEGLHGVLMRLAALAVTDQNGTSPTGLAPRIRAAIRSHATSPGWSLGDCAAALGVSPRQVQRALAAEDDGFAASVTRERLARAARLLRAGSSAHFSIEEIACAVGYAEAAPFARAFKMAYGMTPGQWRRGHA